MAKEVDIMNRLIIIGIIFLFISIGISGCEQIGKTPNNIVSISELKSHPNRYLNTSVTVRGFCYQSSIVPVEKDEYINGTLSSIKFIDYLRYWITEEQENAIVMIEGSIIRNSSKNANVFWKGEYYWTGIVKGSSGSTISLNITDIQSV